jgi:mannose-6-phosphate isomerase-like protein (cupin superfamily)
MKRQVTTRKAQSIRAALRGKSKITSNTTYEEFRAACPRLAAFDRGVITVGRFGTRTPWENHPDGDEFLHILDGRLDVILLSGDKRLRVPVRGGSIFVVPRGVWHCQVPRPVATVLSALPTTHGPLSWAEDPRHGTHTRTTRARVRGVGRRPNQALERPGRRPARRGGAARTAGGSSPSR